jgi:hypothetical protein
MKANTEREIMPLLFATSGLLIPSLYLRAAMICVLGVIIYRIERRLALLVPASPGCVFWFGNFGSYVVGGIGTGLIYDSWNGYGMRYLDGALLYIGLGLVCYIIGMWVATSFVKVDMSWMDITKDIQIKHKGVLILSALFILSVVVSHLYGFSYGDLYGNLVIGAIQSIESLPIILAAIYLMRGGRSKWIVVMLLCSGFMTSIEGISMGYGRGKFLIVFIVCVSVWISLQLWYRIKITTKSKLLIMSSALMLLVLLGFMAQYREIFGSSEDTSRYAKQEALTAANTTFWTPSNVITASLGPIVSRANEVNSLELFGRAESGEYERYGFTYNDLKQTVLAWMPKKYFPEKGEGTGRDIMVEYGFGEGNIPPSLLGDIFRRSGVLGVVCLYFVLGLASTVLAIKLKKSWGSFGIIVSYYFALLCLQFYTMDVDGIFSIFIYRVPSSAVVIYWVLRFSGILAAVPAKSAPTHGRRLNVMKPYTRTRPA